MTLEALLASRDARVAHQARLLGEYPGMSLLCLTVMLPGPEKRSPMSLKIASEAVVAVRSRFEPLFEELRDLETGYEGYFIVDMPPLEAKLAAVALEDSHPLGRLFDLDVIVPASFSVPSSNKPVFEDENRFQPPVSSKMPVFKDENRFQPPVSSKLPVF
ncbi:MAG: citrate lyase holo-[acyl-carrier protein] synthase, partial [Bacteroidales bacterium]|nr:citrate lyase holo-[acyl-carrier protein] synthase [Bacteroidales bacterium]